MPLNSTLGIVQRWMALDEALSWGRVRIDRFAGEHGVNPKRVRQDLGDLQALGQKVSRVEVEADGLIESCYRYAKGQRPLFARNLSA